MYNTIGVRLNKVSELWPMVNLACKKFHPAYDDILL